ncbi:hypothetical protein ACULNC_17700, partial [Shigella flexneri]
KKRLRSGKRNQTMANAESIETVILPSVMLNAITKLLSNIRQNGALFVPTPFARDVVDVQQMRAGDERHRRGVDGLFIQRRRDKRHVQQERITAIPRISMVS